MALGERILQGFPAGKGQSDEHFKRAILVVVWKMESGEARMEKTSKKESFTWLLLLMIFKLTM